MSLQETEYMKYDTVGRFYYLTEAGARETTGYAVGGIWVNAELRLKKHGRMLKRFLTLNPYNNSHLPQRRPIDFFEYMVFKNDNDEAHYIKEMLTEMVEWAYNTDGDKGIYEDGAKEIVPETVKQIAQTQGLQMIGNCDIFIEDAEYRSGY